MSKVLGKFGSSVGSGSQEQEGAENLIAYFSPCRLEGKASHIDVFGADFENGETSFVKCYENNRIFFKAPSSSLAHVVGYFKEPVRNTPMRIDVRVSPHTDPGGRIYMKVLRRTGARWIGPIHSVTHVNQVFTFLIDDPYAEGLIFHVSRRRDDAKSLFWHDITVSRA